MQLTSMKFLGAIGLHAPRHVVKVSEVGLNGMEMATQKKLKPVANHSVVTVSVIADIQMWNYTPTVAMATVVLVIILLDITM